MRAAIFWVYIPPTGLPVFQVQNCGIIEAVTIDTSAARCWQSRGSGIAERNVSTPRTAAHICIRVGGQKPYKPA